MSLAATGSVARGLLLGTLALVLCLAQAHSAQAIKGPITPPRAVDQWLFTGDALEGTFLQLNLGHRSWPLEQWRRELANLRRLGFDTLVLQWTVYDEVSFLSDGGEQGGTVERILAAADQVGGLDVHLGLALRQTWWQTGLVTDEALQDELTRNAELARQLHYVLGRFSSFRGWYIPHEVTELLYTYEQRESIIDFYAALSEVLRGLEPLKPILASGYTDPAKSRVAEFTVRWLDFLGRAGIDILIFQDGAGTARSQDWREILPYVEAISTIDDEFSGDVWLVVEMFTQKGGYPLDEGPFRAEPADFARAREQIETMGGYKKKLIGYTYFDYMRPEASEAAASLLRAYEDFLGETIARTTGSRP